MAISSSQVELSLYFYDAAECPVVCFRFEYHVYYKGCPKKIAYKILKAMWHIHLLEPIYTNLEMIPLQIFCPIKTKVSRIKPYIVMLMGKFGSTGPDFGQ